MMTVVAGVLLREVNEVASPVVDARLEALLEEEDMVTAGGIDGFAFSRGLIAREWSETRMSWRLGDDYQATKVKVV
jgi:hypothetical protein